MKEAYVVCEERNTVEAFRHFLGPGYPGTHEVVRMALRHEITTGIMLGMFGLGLVGWLSYLF